MKNFNHNTFFPTLLPPRSIMMIGKYWFNLKKRIHANMTTISYIELLFNDIITQSVKTNDRKWFCYVEIVMQMFSEFCNPNTLKFAKVVVNNAKERHDIDYQQIQDEEVFYRSERLGSDIYSFKLSFVEIIFLSEMLLEKTERNRLEENIKSFRKKLDPNDEISKIYLKVLENYFPEL